MHKVSGAGHLPRVARNASAGRTLRWDPRRAAGVSKEDKERERREEGEEGGRERRRGGGAIVRVLSVISGSRANGCPGTAWHKQQRQQQQQRGSIFSCSHLSQGTLHRTSS